MYKILRAHNGELKEEYDFISLWRSSHPYARDKQLRDKTNDTNRSPPHFSRKLSCTPCR